MSVEYRTADGVAHVRVTGALDVALGEKVGELGVLAAADGSNTIRVDLAGVTFLDSSGLGALVRIRNAAIESNNHLILANPGDRVLRVLDITGLTPIFDIQHDDGVL
jgi:anti-sigma B factor antagonist